MKMHLSEHKVLPNAAARTKFSAFWQSIANLTDKAGYTWRATLLAGRLLCHYFIEAFAYLFYSY